MRGVNYVIIICLLALMDIPGKETGVYLCVRWENNNSLYLYCKLQKLNLIMLLYILKKMKSQQNQ